jgi:cytochrome P450
VDFLDIPALDGAEPFFGHNRVSRRDRIAFAARIAREPARVVRMVSPVSRVAVVNHPEPVHELLVERADDFEKSAMLRFSLYPLAGEGLFTSGGELWRRQRRLMAPLFAPSQIRAYASDMVACATRAADSWRDGGVVQVARETTRIAMAVAGKTLFDADTFTEADELGEALTVALDFAGNLAGSPLAIGHIVARRQLTLLSRRARGPASALLGAAADRLERPWLVPRREGKKVGAAIAVLDDRVARMIEERRRAPEARADLLTKLLSARDEDGAPMSDRQVRDEVLTLFVAGHETTATGLAWSLYELCKNPELYAEAQREADALTGLPTVDDLPKLGFLLRVFKEALRMYPPVFAFGRTSLRDTTIDGHVVPEFSHMLVLPLSLHHRPDLWPEPSRFDPDRFLPEAEARRPKLAWIPFGAGPRVCIGNHFAMMEAPLVLATLLRRYRFERLSDEVPEPHATLRPRGGMPARVTFRSPS